MIEKEIEKYRQKINLQREAIKKRIIGHDDFIETILICLYSYCNGHLLVEAGVGTGKTATSIAVVKTISDATFKRIQFTADMLPESVYRITKWKEGRIVEYPGPIFANFVLADEINRTSPRGKSGLLEAMGEAQVSFEAETHLLERPFFIMATENPVETVGTYALGWAEADRFMMKVYLEPQDEQIKKKILRLHRQKLGDTKPVISRNDVLEIQEFIRKQIFIDPMIEKEIIRLLCALRPTQKGGILSFQEFNFFPEGERGSLFLEAACKTRAFLMGREYVIREDIIKLAFPILNHRFEFKYQHGRYEKIQLLKKIISEAIGKVVKDGIREI